MLSTLRNAAFLLLAYLMLASFLGRHAYAHYLWVMQQNDLYIVARGTTIPNNLEAYNPNAITLIKGLDQEGGEIPIQRVDGKARVVFRAEKAPSMVAVRCDWGSRVQTTRGKKLMARNEAEQQGFKVLEAFLSTQTSKTLFEDGSAVCQPLNLKFELVPTKSPFQLAPGKPLEVRLYFDGAPLKGAMISSPGHPQTETDDDGMALITGCQKGWNVLMARHKVSPFSNPDINYHQFMTFLVFKVP